jgi:hypothetical protein
VVRAQTRAAQEVWIPSLGSVIAALAILALSALIWFRRKWLFDKAKGLWDVLKKATLQVICHLMDGMRRATLQRPPPPAVTADDLSHKARAAAKETGTAGSRIGRVVLDDRMVVQEEPPLGLQSEHGSSRGSSEPIPDSARNTGLIIDSEVQAVGSWRGRGSHIPARESREFETAARVVGSACRMTAAVTAEKAVHDKNWKTDGAAMAELTGTADPTEQAECFVRLAQVVQRIIERQSTVVTVAAPAKVFGDIHGQLRDLLALFARYGFPTHRGGDVESMSYVFNG